MIQKDENYLSMAAAVIKVLDGNSPIWSGNVPMSTVVSNLHSDIKAVNNAQQGGGAVSTGVTTDKEIAADAAIEQAVRLAGFGQAYALTENDNSLYDALKISVSSLNRLADNELAPALQNIHDKLKSIETEVAPYGADGRELKKLQVLMQKYDGIKSTPRVIIAERKGHNRNIPEILRHMRSEFEKTDKLIKIWADDEPKFLSDYKNARIIIDLGTRHRPVAG